MVETEKEGFNVAKCDMNEFFDDLEGKLTLLTEQVDYKSAGLTLQDVRKPMLVMGLPGIGKTCGIISIIKKLNNQLISNADTINPILQIKMLSTDSYKIINDIFHKYNIILILLNIIYKSHIFFSHFPFHTK